MFFSCVQTDGEERWFWVLRVAGVAKRYGSVCGLWVMVMLEKKFGGEGAALGIGFCQSLRLGLWWWCFDSRRKEIQPDSCVQNSDGAILRTAFGAH
ncbi:unnamed protein product [Prunus brigantina]